MRFVPLVPLACLAVGAALVETVVRAPKDRATRDFSVEIDSASVRAVSADVRSSFEAGQISIEPGASVALGVGGSMRHESGSRNFAAERMTGGLGGGIVLEGGVRIWNDRELLESERVVVDRTGSISGRNVRLTVGGSTVAAEAFRHETNGDLTLEGSVQGTLDN